MEEEERVCERELTVQSGIEADEEVKREKEQAAGAPPSSASAPHWERAFLLPGDTWWDCLF